MRSIIIEGIDRLGKSTLINGIKHRLGYFQVLHYQKPELLDSLLREAHTQLSLPDGVDTPQVRSHAQLMYQTQSFSQMFHLLSSESRFIMDRAHLGELVYASRYRSYDGSYVFDKEAGYPAALTSTLLVLLHTSSFDFIQDDGLSLDFERREEEQMDFVRAFEKSAIKHKVMLDVSDGAGNFVPPDKLADTVVQSYKELETYQHHTMYVSWARDEAGSLDRQTYLQPNLS